MTWQHSLSDAYQPILLAVLCGLACFVQAKRNMRVVNGKEYTIEDAPFMVSFNPGENTISAHMLEAGIFLISGGCSICSVGMHSEEVRNITT